MSLIMISYPNMKKKFEFLSEGVQCYKITLNLSRYHINICKTLLNIKIIK